MGRVAGCPLLALIMMKVIGTRNMGQRCLLLALFPTELMGPWVSEGWAAGVTCLMLPPFPS